MRTLHTLGFLFIATTTAAVADIPTVGYMNQFYNNICHNPNLNLPMGDAPNAIPSQKRTLEIIDLLNNGTTTYASELTSSAIVSVEYVSESLSLLADDAQCCPGGYIADDGICTSCGTWLTESTNECFAAGEYHDGNTCAPCSDGYICPENTSGTVTCGSGYWCADNVRTKCEFGANQCPKQTHTNQPDIIACDDTGIFMATGSDECTDPGEYRNGTTCAPCPDGYVCPAGTNGKIACGAGYWCTGGVRTACEYGEHQCPEYHHDAQPDIVACDNTGIFIE